MILARTPSFTSSLFSLLPVQAPLGAGVWNQAETRLQGDPASAPAPPPPRVRLAPARRDHVRHRSPAPRPAPPPRVRPQLAAAPGERPAPVSAGSLAGPGGGSQRGTGARGRDKGLSCAGHVPGADRAGEREEA